MSGIIMAGTSDTQTLLRYFELKEELAKLQAELKLVQPAVKKYMESKAEVAGIPKVTVSSPEYDKVIEFRRSKVKASLSLALVTECVRSYLAENGMADFADDFKVYLDKQRSQRKKDRSTLSYKAYKGTSASAQEKGGQTSKTPEKRRGTQPVFFVATTKDNDDEEDLEPERV